MRALTHWSGGGGQELFVISVECKVDHEHPHIMVSTGLRELYVQGDLIVLTRAEQL